MPLHIRPCLEFDAHELTRETQGSVTRELRERGIGVTAADGTYDGFVLLFRDGFHFVRWGQFVAIERTESDRPEVRVLSWRDIDREYLTL